MSKTRKYIVVQHKLDVKCSIPYSVKGHGYFF